MNDNGKVRVEYLNKYVLEPAVKEFVERLAETEGLQKATWNKKRVPKSGQRIQDGSLTKFHLYVPHPTLKQTDPQRHVYNLDTGFRAGIYVLNGELHFEVRYNYVAGQFLGTKDSPDLDKLVQEAWGCSDEQFLLDKYDLDIDPSVEKNVAKDEPGIFYNAAVANILYKYISTYSESYPVNEMAEPENICKRLLSLYKENNRLYSDLKQKKTIGYWD